MIYAYLRFRGRRIGHSSQSSPFMTGSAHPFTPVYSSIGNFCWGSLSPQLMFSYLVVVLHAHTMIRWRAKKRVPPQLPVMYVQLPPSPINMKGAAASQERRRSFARKAPQLIRYHHRLWVALVEHVVLGHQIVDDYECHRWFRTSVL